MDYPLASVLVFAAYLSVLIGRLSYEIIFDLEGGL
jgi:hypothetical protein